MRILCLKGEVQKDGREVTFVFDVPGTQSKHLPFNLKLNDLSFNPITKKSPVTMTLVNTAEMTAKHEIDKFAFNASINRLARDIIDNLNDIEPAFGKTQAKVSESGVHNWLSLSLPKTHYFFCTSRAILWCLGFPEIEILHVKKVFGLNTEGLDGYVVQNPNLEARTNLSDESAMTNHELGRNFYTFIGNTLLSEEREWEKRETARIRVAKNAFMKKAAERLAVLKEEQKRIDESKRKVDVEAGEGPSSVHDETIISSDDDDDEEEVEKKETAEGPQNKKKRSTENERIRNEAEVAMQDSSVRALVEEVLDEDEEVFDSDDDDAIAEAYESHLHEEFRREKDALNAFMEENDVDEDGRYRRQTGESAAEIARRNRAQWMKDRKRLRAGIPDADNFVWTDTDAFELLQKKKFDEDLEKPHFYGVVRRTGPVMHSVSWIKWDTAAFDPSGLINKLNLMTIPDSGLPNAESSLKWTMTRNKLISVHYEGTKHEMRVLLPTDLRLGMGLANNAGDLGIKLVTGGAPVEGMEFPPMTLPFEKFPAKFPYMVQRVLGEFDNTYATGEGFKSVVTIIGETRPLAWAPIYFRDGFGQKSVTFRFSDLHSGNKLKFLTDGEFCAIFHLTY